LEFRIKKCAAWAGGLTNENDWKAFANDEKKLEQLTPLPLLKQIPAMQRRRLSPFAKLSLQCALEAAGDEMGTVATVFASRHGDLHKTSQLISNVALNEELSPTQFGLSVHNAVGGQFSIFANNKAPLTATSAGEDSFLMALTDAVCKLNSNNYDSILLVYTDEAVPEIYQQYVMQDEVSVGAALLIERPQLNEINFQLTMKASIKDAVESKTMQVFDFLTFYYNESPKKLINSKRYTWTLTRQ